MATLLGKARNADEGLLLVEQTLQAAERGGAHWYDAELYRVRAGLRRALDPDEWPQVEKDLQKALAAARDRDARFFELRSATDLARLWVERGERHKAHNLLAPILGSFTEGFGMPDLVDATAYLKTATT